jgi:hypothetical protein
MAFLLQKIPKMLVVATMETVHLTSCTSKVSTANIQLLARHTNNSQWKPQDPVENSQWVAVLKKLFILFCVKQTP